jgi:uncharacterized FAD-dependent dehydrogenase
MYPSGEGVGFVVGIISMAIDGKKRALKIAETLN